MTDNQPPERYELEQLLSRDQLEIPDPPSAIGVGKDGEPRLIITKIVNTDFKSYAGTKIIGPFHKVKLIYLRRLMICVGIHINNRSKWFWKI